MGNMATAGCASPRAFLAPAAPKTWGHPLRDSLFGDVVLVVFLIEQCLDGLFTYVRVLTFGAGIEANPLIYWLMLHLGHGPAVLCTKTVAACLGIGLHLYRIHNAVALLAAFYLAVAILPWIAIL